MAFHALFHIDGVNYVPYFWIKQLEGLFRPHINPPDQLYMYNPQISIHRLSISHRLKYNPHIGRNVTHKLTDSISGC